MRRKILPLVMLGIVATIFTWRAHAETCSFEKLIEPLCEKIAAQEKAQEKDGATISFGRSKLPSKSSLANQVAEFDGRKRKLTKAEKEKFAGVLKTAQDYSEKVILDGRVLSELSKEEKGLVERIRSMKLSDLENDHDAAVCRDEGYVGAGRQTNSIILCPILFDYSEAALVHATAIFIGRGIGSCMMALPKAFTKHESIPPELDPFELRCDSRGCSDGGLRTCLVNGSDGKISRAKSADYKTPQAKEFLAAAAKSMNMEVSEAIPKMEGTVKTYPTCFPALTGDQSDSAASDWFGAAVFARYMANEKQKVGAESEDPIESLAYFIDDACRFRKRKDISGLYGHASHEVRFEQVMMKNSELREFLGCKKDPAAKMDCVLSLRKSPAAAPADAKRIER